MLTKYLWFFWLCLLVGCTAGEPQTVTVTERVTTTVTEVATETVVERVTERVTEASFDTWAADNDPADVDDCLALDDLYNEAHERAADDGSDARALIAYDRALLDRTDQLCTGNPNDPVAECYEYDTFDEYQACLDRKLEELEDG